MVENDLEKKNKSIQVKGNSYTTLDAYKVFFWCVFGMVLASFICSFGFNLIAKNMEVEIDEFYTYRWVNFITTILSSIVFALIYFILNKKSGVRQFSEIGLKNKFNYKTALLCLGVSVICLVAISPLINLLDYGFLQIGYAPNPNPGYVADNIGRLFVSLFIMAVLPAFFEELLFRGIILKGLLTKFKPMVAIMISAGLFMLMHGSLQQTVYQFILGLIFGFIAYSSGSIIYSMLTHFLNNALVLVISYFAPTFFTSMIGFTWYWILAIIVIAIVGGLLIGFLISVIKNKVTAKQIKNSEIISAYESKVQNNIKLNIQEQWYMFGGVLLGIIIWIIQTSAGVV